MRLHKTWPQITEVHKNREHNTEKTIKEQVTHCLPYPIKDMRLRAVVHINADVSQLCFIFMVHPSPTKMHSLSPSFMVPNVGSLSKLPRNRWPRSIWVEVIFNVRWSLRKKILFLCGVDYILFLRFNPQWTSLQSELYPKTRLDDPRFFWLVEVICIKTMMIIT